ncbi:helix-turn-helix transcriptional regulator [Archaeoglobus veneficus]|uniref:helix-turn-helix transcriptional regulator n=1 Tax=Archaeoglobus veneficus TaxID=58290 RepID=UPI000693C2EA|nr:MarR family transcriptional regulator [Archaeoglobus veneficus]
MVFGVVKDFVDGLFDKQSKNKPNPTSGQTDKSQASVLLKTLKENERKIVEALINYGEMTQAELAVRTGIPKSTLSRILQDLETRGIIIRYNSGMTKTVKLRGY